MNIHSYHLAHLCATSVWAHALALEWLSEQSILRAVRASALTIAFRLLTFIHAVQWHCRQTLTRTGAEMDHFIPIFNTGVEIKEDLKYKKNTKDSKNQSTTIHCMHYTDHYSIGTHTGVCMCVWDTLVQVQMASGWWGMFLISWAACLAKVAALHAGVTPVTYFTLRSFLSGHLEEDIACSQCMNTQTSLPGGNRCLFLCS